MNFFSVVFLLCLVKGIQNVPVPASPTTGQAYLNKAQNYLDSINASNVKVPTVSPTVGNTVINKPPSLPTVQTTKAPVTTTTTKAPVATTTTTKSPVTTTTTTTTTKAPVTTATTKAPEIITTNSTETATTSVLPETITTTNLPASSTTIPCTTTTSPVTTTTSPVTTTTLQAVTKTTTCEPAATSTPTSGVIVISERFNELIKQLLNLLGEFVKTTDCSESNLLTQLIQKLTDEIDIRSTSTTSTNIGDNNKDLPSIIENGNTSTTNTDIIITRDQIEVTVIHIKDLINQSTSTVANEEMNKIITELVNILTEERVNTVRDNTGEDQSDYEETGTSNKETGASDGETDTSDEETDTSVEGTDTSDEGTDTSDEGTDTSDEGTDTSDGETDTSDGETDIFNPTAQPIQAESPNEGSTSSKDTGDVGSPSDNGTTSISSQIDQLLTSLISLTNNPNGSFDEVTRQLISQLIYALTNRDSISDSNGTHTITATIVGSAQIKELIRLLTNILNEPIEFTTFGSMNQLIKDLINQVTPGSFGETDSTSESSGNTAAETATTTDKTTSNDQINLIASQLLHLNNQPRTTAVNQKINELINQLEGQLLRTDNSTPRDDTTVSSEAIHRLISDIKSLQSQPISARISRQMKQLLDELISQLSRRNHNISITNGNDITLNTRRNRTTFEELLAEMSRRRELRLARRKEAAAIRAEKLAAIRAEKLAAIRAQRRNQQRNDGSQPGLPTSGTDQQVLPKAGDGTADTKLNQLLSGLFSFLI